jgi:DNA-binding NtrC family response regulator
MTRVLLVHEDVSFREVVRAVLEDAGCKVTVASTTERALGQLLATREPLVVLVEASLPGSSGVRLFEAVSREGPWATRHAYICLSTMPTLLPAAVNELLRQLDVPIVPMPFDLDTLIAAVEQAQLALTLERTAMRVRVPVREGASSRRRAVAAAPYAQ